MKTTGSKAIPTVLRSSKILSNQRFTVTLPAFWISFHRSLRTQQMAILTVPVSNNQGRILEEEKNIDEKV